MRKTLTRFIALGVSIMCVLGMTCGCENPFKKGQDPADTNDEILGTEQSYVIVRATDCGPDKVNLCERLNEAIASTGVKVSIEKAENVKFSEDASVSYILIGETSAELSKTNEKRVTNGFASFLMEKNCLSVCASDDRVLWLAVERMVQDCSADGAFKLLEKYQDLKVDYADQSRKGWKLTCPAYLDGVLDESVYSCGYGFVQDGVLSNMQVINDTSVQDFEKWKASLVSNGYREVFSNSIEGDRHVSYQDAFGILYYAYYLDDLNKVRIICDTESIALDEFCYTFESDDHPEFYMLKDNGSVGKNYGDLFLIHASDDSWIVIDGATSSQNDGFCHEIFEFMKKRSAMPNGKIVISAWFISHAHGDHFLGFEWTLRHHADEIDLQRVMLNIPDPDIDTITGVANLENDHANRLFRNMSDWVASVYPDLEVLKVHTGMEIQIADISFTVLYTQEDLLEGWYAKAYQNGLRYYNCSSAVPMIEIDGMRMLELGDNFMGHVTLEPLYDIETTLACDFLKVGHHYIDSGLPHEFYKKLVERGGVQYALVTQSYYKPSGTYLEEKLGDRFVLSQETEWTGFFFNGEEIECHRYPN